MFDISFIVYWLPFLAALTLIFPDINFGKREAGAVLRMIRSILDSVIREDIRPPFSISLLP